MSDVPRYSPDFQWTPLMACPWCGYEFDAVSQANAEVCAWPEPGDMTVCIACAHCCVFVTPATVRRAVPDEIDEEARQVQQDIRRMHARLS